MAHAVAHGDDHGTLFKNIKFFVLQRIPQRSTFLDHVERNGGAVVKLEKQADITIGDRARKDNPTGSVSFQWIEECIRHARLVDKDDYLAAPKHGQVRQPGALRPARSTRNPFTTQDDTYLYRFVKVKERQGASLLGNQIYAELEKENPRHTLQSWRDRWKKYVSIHPPSQADLDQASGGSAAAEKVVDHTPPPSTTSTPPSAVDRTLVNGHQESRTNGLPVKQPRGHTSVSRDVSGEHVTAADVDKRGERQDDPSSLQECAGLDPQQEGATQPHAEPDCSVADETWIVREGRRIQRIPEERRHEAWAHLARVEPKATAEQLARLYERESAARRKLSARRSEARDDLLDAQSTDDESISDTRSDADGDRPESRPQMSIKEETRIDENQRTLTSEPQASIVGGSSHRISPPTNTGLKRSSSPMVIVPSPHSLRRRVHFSSEPNTQDTPRRSARLRGSPSGVSGVSYRHDQYSQDEPHQDGVMCMKGHKRRGSRSDDGEITQRESVNGTARPCGDKGDGLGQALYVDRPPRSATEQDMSLATVRMRQSSSNPPTKPSAMLPRPRLSSAASVGGRNNATVSPANPHNIQRSWNDVEVVDLVDVNCSVNTVANREPSQSPSGYVVPDSGIARKNFSIWQGSDPVEDEKENSRKRKSPSKPHGRPPQALNLTEQGMQFRLEPTVQSIDDISVTEGECFVEVDDTLKDTPFVLHERKRRRTSKERKAGTLNSIDGHSNTISDANNITFASHHMENNINDGRLKKGDLSVLPSSESLERDTETALGAAPNLSSSPGHQRISDANTYSSHHAGDVGVKVDHRLHGEAYEHTREQQSRRTSHRDADQSSDATSDAFQTDSEAAEDERTAEYEATYRDTQALIDSRDSYEPDLMGMPLPPWSPSLPQRTSQPLRARLMQMSQQRADVTLRMGHSSQSSSSSVPLQQTPTKQHRTQASKDLLTSSHSYETTPQTRTTKQLQRPSRVPREVIHSKKRRQRTSRSRSSEQVNGHVSLPRSPAPTRPSNSPSRRTLLDTQALVNADTPSLDLGIPQPFFSQPVPQPHPSTRRSTSPVPVAAASDDQLSAFIAYHVRTLNVPEDIVISALERTSFNSALASEVLEALGHGKPAPMKPGIFTFEDDNALIKGDARAMKRVSLFHGLQRFWERMELLQEMPDLAQGPT